jgi:Lipoxygenase/C2 domain
MDGASASRDVPAREVEAMGKTTNRAEITLETRETPACELARVDGAEAGVTVVGTVGAPIQVVWDAFRPFGPEMMRWWPLFEWVELEPPGVDEVGAVRRFEANGHVDEERLVARDDRAYTETYAFVSSTSRIPIEGALTTVSLKPAGSLETVVTWSSKTRASPLLLPLIELVQRQAYRGAIEGLARYFNPATNILEIEVVRARLPRAWGVLPPSAYVTARLDGAPPQRTCVRPLCASPAWGETLQFNAGVLDERIEISVWDARLGPDALLGRTSVDITRVSSPWSHLCVALEGPVSGWVELSLRTKPELQVLRGAMWRAKALGGWLQGLVPPLAQLGFEIGVVETTLATVELEIARRLKAMGLTLSPANGGQPGNLPGAALLDFMRTATGVQRIIRGLADQFMVLTREIARSVHAGELERYTYARYDEPLQDLPRRVEGLPRQEILPPRKIAGMIQMGLEYVSSQFDLADRYVARLVERAERKAEADPFQAFFHAHVEAPTRVIERWKDDVEFCRQLIQGVNPLVIRAVRATAEIPPGMRSLRAQGKCLQELIDARRLFILDYEKLAGLERHRDMVFYAPIVLVYRETLDKGSRLNLVGLQLTRSAEGDDVVYTAGTSPENRYLYAKIQVACADNIHHQFISHLGLAHLAMEPLVIAHHNVFTPAKNAGHPIGKLLAPHLAQTIGVNYLARQTLISDPEVAFTDRTFAPGTRQALDLILSAWKGYDFFGSSFPKELASRGFDEKGSDGVEGYYYRDDGFKIWRALKGYVEEVVAAVYASDQEVAADPVIQLWALECSAKERADVPGFPRVIVSCKRLVEVLTTIIFRASAFHSAVNFPQREYVTYVPNRPDATFAEMPAGNEDITLDFILLRGLPGLFAASFQISFAYLLSMPPDAPLSQVKAIEDAPPFREIHQRFLDHLAKITDDIRARDAALVKAGKQPYPYLSPDRIASSVAI